MAVLLSSWKAAFIQTPPQVMQEPIWEPFPPISHCARKWRTSSRTATRSTPSWVTESGAPRAPRNSSRIQAQVQRVLTPNPCPDKHQVICHKAERIEHRHSWVLRASTTCRCSKTGRAISEFKQMLRQNRITLHKSGSLKWLKKRKTYWMMRLRKITSTISKGKRRNRCTKLRVAWLKMERWTKLRKIYKHLVTKQPWWHQKQVKKLKAEEMVLKARLDTCLQEIRIRW